MTTPRRILCARHPHLALVAAWRCHPELRGEPIIVGGAPKLRLPVIAASGPAAAAGVRPGQPLREAQQRCPTAAFVSFDETAAGNVREELLARLFSLAPHVEVTDEIAWCDLSGRHAAHPDEAAWAVAIARGIAGVLDGAGVSVGVASSRLVAHTAARHTAARHIRRIPPGEEAAFLAPLPLTAIPVDEGIAARLAVMGLDCIGAVASLSAADLQRQFGPAGMELWHRLRGEDGGGLWHGPHLAAQPSRMGERLVLEGGVGDLEALRFAVHRAAQELGERLRHRGCRAATVLLSCEMEEGEPMGLRSVPLQPPGSGAELWATALELLAALRLPAPVTAVRLEVGGVTPGPGRELDLWRGKATAEGLSGAAARLRARFGAAAVRSAELADDPGDLPERRFRWREPVAVAVVAGRGGSPRGRGTEERSGAITPGTPAPPMPALRR
jgi:DNA polymerase-4